MASSQSDLRQAPVNRIVEHKGEMGELKCSSCKMTDYILAEPPTISLIWGGDITKLVVT